MEWWLFLIIFLGTFLLLLAAGLPVFLSFTIVDILGIFFVWGGGVGLGQFIHSIFSSISTFVLLPVPLFILMGEVMFHSGVFLKALDTLDKWMGRLPGRLCILSVGGATIFSTLSGSSMGTTAMLGSILLPEMQKRGYHKTIAIGSCMSGALAMIIPPSALAVVLASLMEISVGKLLVAGFLPGVLMAVLYVAYVVLRCALEPGMAPDYSPEKYPWSVKIKGLAMHVLPFGIIIFVVTGLIFAGMATPTESAALGVLTTAAVVASYRSLSWEIVRKSAESTLKITVMMFMILTASTAFSQILAFTGASKGLVELSVSFPLSHFFIVIAMQVLMILLGCFMEQVSIMMVTFPIFMPILRVLGYDLIWFGLLTLINMEIGMKTPPFGLCLFVMKGVVPEGITMTDVYRAVIPFVLLDVLAMVVIMFFPAIATILPALMKY